MLTLDDKLLLITSQPILFSGTKDWYRHNRSTFKCLNWVLYSSVRLLCYWQAWPAWPYTFKDVNVGDKYVLNVLVNEKLDTMERKNWEDILLSKSGYFTACWDERSYASMTTNRMSTVHPINLQVIGPSGDFSHLDYATPLDKVIDALPSLNYILVKLNFIF